MSTANTETKTESNSSASTTIGAVWVSIVALFDKTIENAAREAGMSLTAFKFHCRSMGIPRWPYRRIKSVRNRIAQIEEMIVSDERELLLLREKRSTDLLNKSPPRFAKHHPLAKSTKKEMCPQLTTQLLCCPNEVAAEVVDEEEDTTIPELEHRISVLRDQLHECMETLELLHMDPGRTIGRKQKRKRIRTKQRQYKAKTEGQGDDDQDDDQDFEDEDEMSCSSGDGSNGGGSGRVVNKANKRQRTVPPPLVEVQQKQYQHQQQPAVVVVYNNDDNSGTPAPACSPLLSSPVTPLIHYGNSWTGISSPTCPSSTSSFQYPMAMYSTSPQTHRLAPPTPPPPPPAPRQQFVENYTFIQQQQQQSSTVQRVRLPSMKSLFPVGNYLQVQQQQQQQQQQLRSSIHTVVQQQQQQQQLVPQIPHHTLTQLPLSRPMLPPFRTLLLSLEM